MSTIKLQAYNNKLYCNKIALIIMMIATNCMIAKDCINLKKHLVTASYISKEMRALEQSESVRAASKQAALGAFLGGLGGAADAAVQYQAYQDAAARRNIAADATIDPETAEKLENF